MYIYIYIYLGAKLLRLMGQGNLCLCCMGAILDIPPRMENPSELVPPLVAEESFALRRIVLVLAYELVIVVVVIIDDGRRQSCLLAIQL